VTVADADTAPDLASRYLGSLGLEPRDLSLESLAAIVLRHVAELAFSSVGPRLGDELPLDPESLFDRIVARRRGGYCFEHNGLLFAVLEALGYDVHVQMARVIHNQDVHPGLTHRITRVVIDGREYVVDVGFGPMGPPRPVPMESESEAPIPGAFRVHEPRPGELHMQCVVDGDWYSLYRFDRSRYGQSDAELGHFYSHRHPDATFVNNLVASRILDDEVRSLRNRTYWLVRDTDPTTETVGDAHRLHSLLTGDLGLRVSEAETQRLFDDLPVE
jgi:N-hydroxyarylamine O-acetyltransferase